MDKSFEEVKKILKDNTHISWERFGNVASNPIPVLDIEKATHQICQLFEPQISPYALPSQAYDEYFTPPEPKPDERLLTEADIIEAGGYTGYELPVYLWVAELQLAKDQQRIEKFIEEIENKLGMVLLSNSYIKVWQALKKQEGIG